jgi:hypothetical protein
VTLGTYGKLRIGNYVMWPGLILALDHPGNGSRLPRKLETDRAPSWSHRVTGWRCCDSDRIMGRWKPAQAEMTPSLQALAGGSAGAAWRIYAFKWKGAAGLAANPYLPDLQRNQTSAWVSAGQSLTQPSPSNGKIRTLRARTFRPIQAP